MLKPLSSASDLYDALNAAYGNKIPTVVKRNISVSLSNAGYLPEDIPSAVISVTGNTSKKEYRRLLLEETPNQVFYHHGYCFILSPR
jgi:hypothetical protein